MSTTIVVPVRDQVDVTRRFLLAVAEQEFDRLLVFDNGSASPTVRLLRSQQLVDPRVRVLRRQHAGIYAMWNEGFARARAAADGEPFNVLVTNNDVELPPGALAELVAWLRSSDDLWAVYPDYDARSRANPLRLKRTRGVEPDGGMTGSCFLLAGERITWQELVSDPGYEWWYGDNHLARQIEEEGGVQARVVGLPVAHVGGATARLHHDELQAMIRRDRLRWLASARQRHSDRAPRRTVPGTRLWAPRGARRE